jgi:hypothetical protein
VAQHADLIDFIAHLAGTPLQEDLVRTTDRLLRLGHILTMSQGPPAAPPLKTDAAQGALLFVTGRMPPSSVQPCSNPIQAIQRLIEAAARLTNYTALANLQGCIAERLARWLLMARDRLDSTR